MLFTILEKQKKKNCETILNFLHILKSFCNPTNRHESASYHELLIDVSYFYQSDNVHHLSFYRRHSEARVHLYMVHVVPSCYCEEKNKNCK